MIKSILASVLLAAAATTAQAQSVIFGAGYADFSNSDSDDLAIFSLEYQHKPFHQATRFGATWGAALSVDEDGNTHIGAGLIGIYSLSDRWFVEGSVMPGYFNASDNDNDLGGEFQIRSLLGLGYTLDSGNKVSMAITHKSNASTQDDNPGVNTLLLRYHYAF
ncbi:acyloxyacyl hydrolase [Rhodobacteraceae bacterium B1Z28]|uniref:Acyloxyacyl hydrolase n=1 Tax=Ruegeria haliotis TaxID=2747601 RepID=A0ABX2PTU6_9RHOB|nr:acyloxyacyl hydrolase [Ruegeria haliotis]NVO57125.1 acyloxyacyl hydrolase [Ruegeria haliotis]